MSQTSERLPDLSEAYPLTADQIDAYQRDGHLLLRGVCSPNEVAAYRPILTETVHKNNPHTRKLEERDTYGKAFIQVGNLWTREEKARPYVLARRFAHIAAQLMQAGDATFHAGWTLHSAPGNSSDTDREVMTVIYYANGTYIMNPPDNPSRWNDLKHCHPGVQPGEPAVSELNPLLYQVE